MKTKNNLAVGGLVLALAHLFSVNAQSDQSAKYKVIAYMKALRISKLLLAGALVFQLDAARAEYAPTEDCLSASGRIIGNLTLAPNPAYFILERLQILLVCEQQGNGYRCNPKDGGEFGDGYPSAVFQGSDYPRTGQIFYSGAAGEEPSYDDLTCQ